MDAGDDQGTRGPIEGFEKGLRAHALRDESMQAEPIHLGEVWRELCGGHWKIADSFHSSARCYLVLISAPAPKPSFCRQTVRNLSLLEKLLLEGPQKRLALALGVSTSTIAGACKDGLAALGLCLSASKVPPLLVMAAHDSKNETRLGDERVSRLYDGTAAYRVVSATRPDHSLQAFLPPAELAVARLLIDGKSHAEIAAARNASRRTIANQLASVFQRLSVSGRCDLLLHLSQRRSAYRPANGNA